MAHGMARLAAIAEAGKAALVARDEAQLAALMDENFDIRRRLFGDAALGAVPLRLVELPRAFGAAAKFTGSGGAALVLCPQGYPQARAIASAAEVEGFCMEEVRIGPDRSAQSALPAASD